MRLILVRHGETNWNVDLKLQSYTDNPLNELGKKQVEKTAKYLKNEKIDLIFSSPLKRAKQTAQIINKFHKKKIIITPKITERNFGKLEEMHYPHFKDKLTQIHKTNSYEKYEIEKIENLKKRINEFFKLLLKNHFDKTILVTSHSSALKMLLSLILNDSFGEVFKLKKKNASISIIEFDENNKLKSKLIAIDGHLE